MAASAGFGFTYFVGAVYYVFGRNQLLVQFLNATLGSLSVVVIYATARLLFDAGVARWAALFMAFFPQMVFWSCAMYKDPAVLLCIAVSMYAMLRLRGRFSSRVSRTLLAAVLALMTLRFYVFYMVVIATLGTFVFSQRRGLVSGLFGQVVMVLAFSGAMFLGVRGETVRQQQDYLNLEHIQVARADQANLARSGFGGEIDVSTPAGAVAALPMGLVYMLLAPFPWSVSGIRQLLTVPEMLVWYALTARARTRPPAHGQGETRTRPAHSRVRVVADRFVRGLPEQRGHCLSTAYPDQHVLLHLHGARARASKEGQNRGFGGGTDPVTSRR